jgi:hypothetical protein
LGNDSPYKNFLKGRNKIWLITKNYPFPRLLFFLPVIVSYDLMSILYSALKTHDLSALKGRLAGVKQIPLFWRKRQQIQRRWGNNHSWQRWMAPLAFPADVLKRYTHLQ